MNVLATAITVLLAIVIPITVLFIGGHLHRRRLARMTFCPPPGRPRLGIDHPRRRA